jgi:hypothetical protein
MRKLCFLILVAVDVAFLCYSCKKDDLSQSAGSNPGQLQSSASIMTLLQNQYFSIKNIPLSRGKLPRYWLFLMQRGLCGPFQPYIFQRKQSWISIDKCDKETPCR